MNAQPEKVEQLEDDSSLAAVSEVEAGIRDFVRNDIAYLRRPGIAALGEADQDTAVTNVNSLIQRVAGASLGEIENLITELERLRDMLHSEGQRVQREIAGYAQLSHAAMKSTRIIAENMTQWKSANEQVRHG
jgi:CII-binding regulator of phage lambda lysogenization HflD